MLVYGLAGIGQAGYSTATAAYSIDMAQSKSVGRAIAWTQAARQTALSIGPALGGVLATVSSIDVVFTASAAVALAGTVISGVFLPEVRSESGRVEMRQAGRAILRSPLILAALIGVFTLQFANSVFSSFTPIYAGRLSYAAIGVIFTVQGLMNMVGRPVVGELSSRIRNRTLVVSIGMLLSFTGLIIFSLSADFEPLILVALLVGLSTGLGVVLLLITIAEQAPKEGRGFTMGFFNMALYLGLGVGPAVEGIVIENFGYATAFQTTAVVPLIGLLIYSTVARHFKTAQNNLQNEPRGK